MIRRFDFAPLDGITKRVFRQVWHKHFGGADRYFVPFLSPTDQHVITPRDRRELENPEGLPQVPQVMAKRAADFVWAAGALADMGYREVNLNLGCPSGTVTAKGKGAGFLARPVELGAFFEEVFPAAGLPVSVKTRLGFRDEGEFPVLLEIFNRYPLKELIVHARVREDFYKKPARLTVFAAALPVICAPVVYNGDLFTAEDVDAFARRFPQVEAVMLGRGLLMDPALPRKLAGGPAASREELQVFTQTLYRGYQEAYGHAGSAAQRMKELWFYLIRLFDSGEKYDRRMRRVKSPGEYEALEAGIFRDLPLRQRPATPLERGF